LFLYFGLYPRMVGVVNTYIRVAVTVAGIN